MTRAVALTFPGQGSQRIGMLDAVPSVAGLERLLDAAEALSGRDLRRLAAEGPEADLSDTRAAQPLLYLADWAWGRALLDVGVQPAAVAGHSLGELAALAVAGVYSVEAGLELVVERSKLMAQAAQSKPGTMAAILGLGAAEVAAQLAEADDVWVANDNAVGQVVISGSKAGVERATELLAEAGARKVVPLKVAGAFHSPYMDAACRAFADLLGAAEFSDALFPVYQNTDPEPTTDANVIRARLADQISSPVRWTETLEALRRDGIDVLVEAGPGTVLVGLSRRVEGITAIAAETAGVDAVAEEVSV